MKPTTIGFIGSPGAGKSTLAYGTVYLLKQMGYSAELCPELMKEYVMFGGDNTNPENTTAIALKQLQLEQQYRKLPLDFLVCETTLLTPLIYATFYNMRTSIINLSLDISKLTTYDFIFFVRPFYSRDTYEQIGRCESYEQSIAIDSFINLQFTQSHPHLTIHQLKNQSADDIIRILLSARALPTKN